MTGGPWIQVTGTPEQRAELPRQGVLRIGSSPAQADLVVEGQGVADVHCVVGRAKGGGWALKDLGSEYGTIVNGSRVRSARLAEGDVVVLGSRRLEVTASEAVGPPDEPGPKAPAPPKEELPRVAGFRIERRLGRGGMGTVYLAVQESLDRRVALKVLSPRLAGDRDFVQRFVSEARAAAALHHPNVVTVFDVGQDGDRHWLAMEYMDRGNLEARVAREGPLPWTEVREVLRDAARGLVFAETKGIVHRDIKPANLMQASAGGTKIADLGLATHLEAEAEAESSGERRILGTPHFIAPEQARGERVDARSDLYSLGATAYRLLTGRTPFEGETTRDILRAHFTEEPTPISALVPGVPPALAELVHRLLAKKPDDRYASAALLLSALERLETGPPAPATRPGRPRRALSIGALLVAAALTTWILVARRGTAPEPPEPPRSAGERTASGPEPAAPPAATQEPADSEANAEETAQPADDDRDLEMLELQAELAYRDLAADLAPGERVQSLRALAQDFPGTTVATRARAEADSLERRAAETAEAERERDERLGAALAALRQAGAMDSEPFDPGRALKGLLAADVDPAVAQLPGFAEKRRQLFLEAGRRARAEVRAVLARSAELESAGDFDGSRAALRSLLERLELPDLPEELRFEDLVLISMDARDVRSRLEETPQRERQYEWQTARDDAVRLAQALGGPGGFESELAAGKLGAARARIEGVQPASAAARALCGGWSAELRGAQRALDSIAQAWKDGLWRRRALPDPRPGRGGTVEVRAVGPEGLEVDGGDTIPWSDLLPRARSLHDLFYQRLERDWTAPERADVGALLWLSASLQAVRGAEEMLVPERRATFTAGEAAELTEGYAHARAWCEGGDPERIARIDREEAAAARLAEALRAASDGRTVAATAALEELLAEFRETLVVRLLSDGSGLVDPPPEAAASTEEPEAVEGSAQPAEAVPRSQDEGEEPGGGEGR